MTEKLLVVDDEVKLLRAVDVDLRAEGYDVTTAQSGVDAYVTKPFEPDELLVIIAGILRRVERTHTEISRIFGETEAENSNESFIDEALTETEVRVANAIARGLSNKEIAREFGISVRTVEHHVAHILSKKNFANRVEIALHAKGQNKTN